MLVLVLALIDPAALAPVVPPAARLGTEFSVVDPVVGPAALAFCGWPSSRGSCGAVLASVTGALGCSGGGLRQRLVLVMLAYYIAR